MHMDSFMDNPDFVTDTLIKVVKGNKLVVDEPIIEASPSVFNDLVRIDVMWTSIDNGWANRIKAFLERKKLQDIAVRIRNV